MQTCFADSEDRSSRCSLVVPVACKGDRLDIHVLARTSQGSCVFCSARRLQELRVRSGPRLLVLLGHQPAKVTKELFTCAVSLAASPLNPVMHAGRQRYETSATAGEICHRACELCAVARVLTAYCRDSAASARLQQDRRLHCHVSTALAQHLRSWFTWSMRPQTTM